MRKREITIGEVVSGTKLRVLAPEESDARGNQRVLVQCEWIVNGNVCGAQKVKRVSDMTMKPYEDKNGKVRLPHTSCGCQSKRASREYWEKRARGIRRLVQQKIYRGHKTYKRSFADLARRYNMPLQLVTTIFRVYAERIRQK